MTPNTAQRTSKEEFLDDFSLEGDELHDALDKIASINQWLGGNRVTLDGLKKLIKGQPNDKVISIIDVGCGNGDMCRAIADLGKKEGITFTILGIDANADAITYAKACSKNYSSIAYASINVFDEDFAALSYDIAVCTLTLHHFPDNEILQLMRLVTSRSTIGVVINDLQRSTLAYRLFQLICFVFQLNTLSKEDGLTSILRGFKKRDLEAFSKQLALKDYSVSWKWAFRYQWIIKNL